MSHPEHKDTSVIPLSQMGSFEQFFREQYPYVCQIVHRYVGDKSKVEDIAQEIFAELWVKRDAIFIHTSMQAYLRRMAVTRALNYIRDMKKHDWDELDMASEQLQGKLTQDISAINQLEESELRSRI